MRFARFMFSFVLGCVFGLATMPVIQAAEPLPWQLGFQPAATPVMEEMITFHNLLLWIIVAITLFVLFLLLYVMVRFRAKRNPTPSQTSHNTVVEIIWTVIPVIILVIIAIPSFKLLYFSNKVEKPELTIKATGYQWYWTYEYPDQQINFESRMVLDKDLKEGQIRLLSVDNHLVVPVDTNVEVLITAFDVLHSWAVPSFGVKTDAVPGRLNHTWFRATKEGTYYGQCSELCGKDHAFMPIEIKVVSKEDYALWLEEAKTKFSAGNDQHNQSITFVEMKP